MTDVLANITGALRGIREIEAKWAVVRAEVKELLPVATAAGEGLVLTIWEKDVRHTVEQSGYVEAGTVLVLYPDRLAPVDVSRIRFDPADVRPPRTEYSLLRAPSLRRAGILP